MPVADKLSALRIKANIIADKTVGLMEINAEVGDHVAVLTGEVQTEEQKRIAEELAYEIEEIDEVINEIRIVPAREDEPTDAHLGYSLAEGNLGETAFAIGGESAGPGAGLASSEQFPGEFTDEQIEQEARDKLAAQSMVDTSDVRLKSVNQMVYLEGSVNTADDLYNLHDIVLSVRGVMGVSSDVGVKEGDIGTPTE